MIATLLNNATTDCACVLRYTFGNTYADIPASPALPEAEAVLPQYSEKSTVCDQALPKSNNIQFLIICRHRYTFTYQVVAKQITDDCQYRKYTCNDRHTTSGKHWIAIYRNICNQWSSCTDHKAGREAPTERHVDKEALSVGSGEIADAIDPYGILMEV